MNGRWSVRLILLLLVAGCGLDTRIEREVPGNVPEGQRCGDLLVASGEDPPYSAGEEANDEDLEEALRDAAVDAGIAPGDIDQAVEDAIELFEEPATYGIALAARFESFRDGDRPRSPCPRFVQIVRSRVRVVRRGAVLVNQGFAANAAQTPWAQNGGTPDANGWFVDKDVVGTDPVFATQQLPGVFQRWSSGVTRMIDTPGIREPWVTNRVGDRIVATFQFRTWLLAPCEAADVIEDGTLDELGGGGGGGGAAGRLDCETFPNQPPEPLRVPIGHFRWGFTVEIVVGEDADETDFDLTDIQDYQWTDGAADAIYRGLMANNYPGWVPPQ